MAGVGRPFSLHNNYGRCCSHMTVISFAGHTKPWDVDDMCRALTPFVNLTHLDMRGKRRSGGCSRPCGVRCAVPRRLGQRDPVCVCVCVCSQIMAWTPPSADDWALCYPRTAGFACSPVGAVAALYCGCASRIGIDEVTVRV